MMGGPHVILLWSLVDPGQWVMTVNDQYKTYDECHKVIHFLRDYNHVKPRPWHKWHEYILAAPPSSGYMWADKCKEGWYEKEDNDSAG